MIKTLTGEYALNPQIGFLVHEVDQRLFALPKGAPLAEVELFIDDNGVIFSPAVDVSLEIQERDQDRVVALAGQMEGREIRLVREERRTTAKQ